MPLPGTRRSVCGCLLLWAVGRIPPKRRQDQLSSLSVCALDRTRRRLTMSVVRKWGRKKERRRALQDGKEVKPTELVHPLTVSPDDNIFPPPTLKQARPPNSYKHRQQPSLHSLAVLFLKTRKQRSKPTQHVHLDLAPARVLAPVARRRPRPRTLARRELRRTRRRGVGHELRRATRTSCLFMRLREGHRS